MFVLEFVKETTKGVLEPVQNVNIWLGIKEGRSNEIAVNAIDAQLYFIFTLRLKQMDRLARLCSIPLPYRYLPFICIFYPFEKRSTVACTGTTALDTVPVLYNKYLRFFASFFKN